MHGLKLMLQLYAVKTFSARIRTIVCAVVFKQCLLWTSVFVFADVALHKSQSVAKLNAAMGRNICCVPWTLRRSSGQLRAPHCSRLLAAQTAQRANTIVRESQVKLFTSTTRWLLLSQVCHPHRMKVSSAACSFERPNSHWNQNRQLTIIVSQIPRVYCFWSLA